MRNKKGIIGSFLTSAIATIVIAAILIVFVLVSGAVKVATSEKTGLKIDKEKELGIENIYSYMDDYVKLVSERSQDFKGVAYEK